MQKKISVGKKKGDFFISKKRKTGIILQHMLQVLLVTWFEIYFNGRLQSGLKIPAFFLKKVSILRFNCRINVPSVVILCFQANQI